MTAEDARTEWLLKFGYRAIDTDDMTDEDYFLCGALHRYKPTDLLTRRKNKPRNRITQITYQLKTPEEIQEETKNNK